MSLALALQSFSFDEIELPAAVTRSGAQTLLVQPSPKPAYLVQGAAVAIYILALSGLAFYSAHPAQPADEDAVELVMLPPVAQEEPPAPPPPPPVAEEPPPPPPPPVAEEPAVAPVEPPPPAPKPQPKPKVVEHKPVLPAQNVAAPPPNALASSYTSQAYSRIMAAAAGLASRAGHQAGRVGYHIVISPSGSVVSQSITSSGNPAIDALAEQALARSSFPSTGLTRNASLHGAIVFQ